MTPPPDAPSSRPGLCVLTRQRVVGRTNGSSTYLLDLLGHLKRQGFAIHYLSPSPATFGRHPVLWLRPEARALFDSYRIRRGLRLGPMVWRLDPRVYLGLVPWLAERLLGRLGIAFRLSRPAPYAIGAPLSDADRAYVARHAPPLADAILADYCFHTPLIAAAGRPDAPSLVLMHDLFCSRGPQFRRLGGADSVAALTVEAEMALLAGADAVIAIQEEEAAFVRRHLPGQTVVVAPMAARLAPAPAPGRADEVLFVGSNTAPNVDGLGWFLSAVWPLVRRVNPLARLKVAGAVCGAVAPGGDGVTLLGLVPDLAPLYRDAGVVVSPLRVGSGLKIKLIEALAWGKAMVATPVTLQGVADLVGDGVRVADSPAAFAGHILDLLGAEPTRRAQATRGWEVARDAFGAERCYGPVAALLRAGRA